MCFFKRTLGAAFPDGCLVQIKEDLWQKKIGLYMF